MNYTIVGLFPSQESIKEVSAGLEKSGIKNQDYIIYRTDQENSPLVKKNFWEKLFGAEKNEVFANNDNLITSVSITNDEELKNVTAAFEQNKVVKMYEFQNMSLELAKDLPNIKKMVALRAKSHIYAMPEMSVSAMLMNEL